MDSELSQQVIENLLDQLEELKNPSVTPGGAYTVRQLFDRKSCTYTYLLVSRGEAVLIDPVLEMVERDLEAIAGLGGKLKFVLNTHVHADHITGSGKLKSIMPSLKSVVSAASGAVADVLVSHGDKLSFGDVFLQVLSTPGHTPGCVSYLLDTSNTNTSISKRKVFTGDAVLIRGCGRTDFQGGDAGTLYDSVMANIFSLPDNTTIWPGHDYSGRTVTSVAEEKANNPRLGQGKAKEDFIGLMNQKFDGSSYPGAIDIALPANMVCGVFEGGFSGRAGNDFDAKTAAPVKHPHGFVWKTTKPPFVVKADNFAAIHKQIEMQESVVLDFRDADELAEQPGVVGSISLPSTPKDAADNAVAAVARLVKDKDTPIVAYCGSGKRAGLACARLAELGYANCINAGALTDVLLSQLHPVLVQQ